MEIVNQHLVLPHGFAKRPSRETFIFSLPHMIGILEHGASCASWDRLQNRLLRTQLKGDTDIERIAFEVVKNRTIGSDMAANKELLRMYSEDLLPNDLAVDLKLSNTIPDGIKDPLSIVVLQLPHDFSVAVKLTEAS